jgi:hypothetical protein
MWAACVCQHHVYGGSAPFYTELALDGRTVTARTSLSVNDDAGDTDVLLVVDLDSREDLAAMFEDNINANFQPAQAYRYSERGKPRMQLLEQQSYEVTKRAEMKLQAEERK